MSDSDALRAGRGVLLWQAQPRGWLIVAAVQALLVVWVSWLDDSDALARFTRLLLILCADALCLIVLRSTSRRGVAALLVVTGGTLAAVGPIWVEIRHASQDKSVSTHQIRAAIAQFFLEFPERVFVTYDEIVGATRYVKAINPVTHEDYTAMFPVRRDWDLLPVTMDDGRKVIILAAGHAIFVSPRGKVTGPPEDASRYRALLAAQAGRDGVEVTRADNGELGETAPNNRARFETTWRHGVREGPFRAYYENGALWAEANYAGGQPAGRHVVYDRHGLVIQETTFAPRAVQPPR